MVLGVVGGSGGVGASTFAAVLAARAAAMYGHSVLVDLDIARGGIDILLGIEGAPGARWSGLRLGGGHLEPQALVAGLPQWRDVAVLAADRCQEPEAEGVDQVIAVARQAGPVVLDLPRWPGEARTAALSRCELVVLVVRADIAGVTGARTVAGAIDSPMGVLVRGRSSHGVAELIGADLLGRLPRIGRLSDSSPDSGGARMRQVASGVLDAVAAAA